MHWFFIALIGPFLWSLVNHADKYLLSKYTKESEGGVGSLMIFSTLFSVFLLPILFYIDRTIFSVSVSNILLLLLVGILNAVSILLYMHALEDEEASVVVPLFQLMPVFGYIIAYVVLGEVLSWQKIFAGCVVVFGAVVLSLEFSEERKISLKKKTLIFMIFSTFLIALSDVLFKWAAIESGGFWSSTFWNYSGLVIVGVIMFCFIKTYRKEFISLLKSSGKNIISLNVASEFTTIVGNITFSFATLLAPIALVMTVASYQPVFVFLLGIILTIFLPGVITEKISSRHLLHKGIAIGIILVGSYLVNTV